MAKYLGFDIGGTKSAVVLGDETGAVLHRTAIATAGPAETLAQLFDAAEPFAAEAASAGISCGGPLDEAAGVILSPPNLPGWDRVEIVRMIRERFGRPARLCNDANACALAEWRFGAGQGSRSMAFLTFGTGLGAGLILDGRLYTGVNGNAGEIGHIRMSRFGPVGYGKEGSLEGFVSGSGLAQTGRTAALELLQRGQAPAYCKSMADLDTVTAKTIADAADAGDPTAIEVYRRCGERLGEGLAILVDILNLDRIVIGSIFQRSENLLRPAMEAAMQRECLPEALRAVQVVPAALGNRIGDLAALSLAMEIDAAPGEGKELQ